MGELPMELLPRVIDGLGSAGWSSEDICNFILWICTGDEQYRPQPPPGKEVVT